MVKPDALGNQPCGYSRAKGVNYASRFAKKRFSVKRGFQIGLLRTVNRLAQKPSCFSSNPTNSLIATREYEHTLLKVKQKLPKNLLSRSVVAKILKI